MFYSTKPLFSIALLVTYSALAAKAATIVAFSGSVCDGSVGNTVQCDGSCHQFSGRHSLRVSFAVIPNVHIIWLTLKSNHRSVVVGHTASLISRTTVALSKKGRARLIFLAPTFATMSILAMQLDLSSVRQTQFAWFKGTSQISIVQGRIIFWPKDIRTYQEHLSGSSSQCSAAHDL